jgi:hypothetical protein
MVRHKQYKYDFTESEECKPHIHSSEKCAVRCSTTHTKNQVKIKLEIYVKKGKD